MLFCGVFVSCFEQECLGAAAQLERLQIAEYLIGKGAVVELKTQYVSKVRGIRGR